MRIVICLLSISFLFAIQAYSQDSCMDTVTYYAKTMGDGKGSLPMSFTIQFRQDTVSFFLGKSSPQTTPMIKMIILSRKCEWNEDRTIGESHYNAVLADNSKKGIINVVFKEGRKTVSIVYENAKGPIVFEL